MRPDSTRDIKAIKMVNSMLEQAKILILQFPETDEFHFYLDKTKCISKNRRIEFPN